MTDRGAKAIRHRLSAVAQVFVAVALLVGWAPGAAYSSTPFVWVSNLWIVGSPGGYGTSGYGPRDYIQVTRPSGYCVKVHYEETDGTTHYSPLQCAGSVYKWNTSNGYARAWCDDYAAAYLPFTCETTIP